MPERYKEDRVVLHVSKRPGRSNGLVGDFSGGEGGKLPSLESVKMELESRCGRCLLVGQCKPKYVFVESSINMNPIVTGARVSEEGCKLKGADIQFLLPR